MLGECVHNLAAGHGLTVSLFLGGLVGSMTHCVGMCAPFVLAQTDAGPVLQKPALSLLLPYHLGRMTTYIALGALVHSVINLAYFFSGAKALITVPLLMTAGIMFLVSAFPSWSAFFPWVARLPLSLHFSSLTAKAAPLFHRAEILPRYMLGVLLGFMPCGLVVAALMATATAPTLPEAMIGMAAFSLGTMPALMAIGLCGKSIKQKFPLFSHRFSQTAMVISSLWLFTLAGMLIF